MSDHTLSRDLAALACTVAAVSPELADRAAALETDVAALRRDEAQWQSELDAANNRAAFAESEAQRCRASAGAAQAAIAHQRGRAAVLETALTAQRELRQKAERRLAALEEFFVGSVGGYQCAIVGEKDVRAATLTDLADAIIAAPQQEEATDATQ